MPVILMQHQKLLVDVCRGRPRLGIGWEPGCGKTIGMYATIADAKSRGFTGRTVVVAPKSVLRAAWERDGAHFPSLSVCVVVGAPCTRRRLIGRGADVLIMGFDAFKGHAAELLEAGVTRLVIDEASKLRNRDSAISKAAFTFSTQVSSVYLLSGTPAPNGEHEFFALLRCIEPNLFGTQFWRFIGDWFVPIRRTFGVREVVTGFRMRQGRETAFAERLGRCWWSLRASQCLDLPEETDEVREAVMEPEQTRIYMDLLSELRHEWEDGQTTEVSAETRTMKLRQITGGTLYDGRQARQVGRSKLDVLREVLNEEIPGQQLVVWCVFRSEIDRVTKDLADQGISVSRIDGSTGGAERSARIADFQAGRLRVLVCHPAAAGHGITLTAARYDCFFSLDFSLENHEQARKRIHRAGQCFPVVHYYLISRGTVDEKVLKVLRRKASASDAIKELLGRRVEMEAI